MADPVAVLAGTISHFGLAGGCTEQLAAGPAFTRNSKSGNAFSSTDRAQDQAQAMAAHGDEIEKVLVWAEAVAANAGVAMTLRAGIIG